MRTYGVEPVGPVTDASALPVAHVTMQPTVSSFVSAAAPGQAQLTAATPRALVSGLRVRKRSRFSGFGFGSRRECLSRNPPFDKYLSNTEAEAPHQGRTRWPRCARCWNRHSRS